MRTNTLILAAVTAAFMSGSMMLGGIAQAQNLCPGVSATQCEQFCGSAGVQSCTKSGPTPDCVCNPQTKNNPGNAFGTATQGEAEGQGNLGNKTETECTGNQGQCKKL